MLDFYSEEALSLAGIKNLHVPGWLFTGFKIYYNSTYTRHPNNIWYQYGVQSDSKYYWPHMYCIVDSCRSKFSAAWSRKSLFAIGPRYRILTVLVFFFFFHEFALARHHLTYYWNLSRTVDAFTIHARHMGHRVPDSRTAARPTTTHPTHMQCRICRTCPRIVL